MPSQLSALKDLGWDDAWEATLADRTLTPGRVSRIDRGAMTVLTDAGAIRARAARDLPVAVGDWVTIEPGHDADDLSVVVTVLPRRSLFRRMADGPQAREQVVAANIDTVLLVTAIDGHLSVRHMTRYLALAWRSGATPVVVITKADLAGADKVAEWSEAMQTAAPGVAVHVVSTTTGQGIEGLAPYLVPGRTVALLGLSGAGKSTLVNHLAGAEVLVTSPVRSDGQGRHTTTHRELVVLPGGGLIIDTPGMRALSVAGAAEGVRAAFADVETLATRCEFADCTHQPGVRGCAVMAAVAAGELSAERVATWLGFGAQQEAPSHQADRLQVLTRKRRKATAKVARRAARAETVKFPPPP